MGWWLWGRGDDQQGELEEISPYLQSVSVWIPKIIQIWHERKIVAVKTKKDIFGSQDTENLIKSTCLI